MGERSVTYGPAYDPAIDGKRIMRQHERIRSYMLARGWVPLAQIALDLDYPEASVSAQLRHLRKPRFGGHTVDRERRESAGGGTWIYRLKV